ncbi:hypothetical protein Dimus_022871, partial [Dionaea muscipula]
EGAATREKSKGAATASGDRRESDVGDVSRAAPKEISHRCSGEPEFQLGLLRYGRVRTRLTSVSPGFIPL